MNTEVNRVGREFMKAKSEYYSAMRNLWGPRWMSYRSKMLSGQAEKNARNRINNATSKLDNVQKKFNSALNKNANSLEGQAREIRRKIDALYANVNAAKKALKNLNTRKWYAKTNAERNAIEKEKNRYKMVLENFDKNEMAINAQRNRLMNEQLKLIKGMEMRERILTRKPSKNEARAIIGRALSKTIVPRVLYGPYGTRTLNAMKRFPGYKPPTLENYAAVMRELNRERKLRRASKL